MELCDFKPTLKNNLKPTKYKHYSYGSRLGNKLLTRLRLGRSYLNSHGYTIGKVTSPACLCHSRNETVKHYMLECFLYTIERQSLLEQVEQHVAGFASLSQENKLNILIFGFQDNEKFPTNIKIMPLVQNYIIQTKRFLIRR